MERPDPALKLLLCENKSEASQLLTELKEWNKRRKDKEAEITEMAMEQVKALYGETIPTVIVVAGENWHVGVIGIVAAKLAQEFHRPSAVLSIIDGMAHASARAVPGFNWHKALFESRELFDRWGGHANAAGFSLEAGKIEELRGRLLQSAKDQGYTGEIVNTDESYPFDIKIALRELVVETRVPTGRYPIRDRSILEYIDLLEPFGGNFPYPAFRAEGVTVHRVRELRGGHLQMEISQAGSAVFPAIAFGLRKSKALLGRSRPITVVFEPIWNYYNNNKTVQLCIKSIE
jgi:single-stranded-DNA-specific exonuclease